MGRMSRADRIRWPVVYGRRLACAGFPPDLILLAFRVREHLPDGLTEPELHSFLLRHQGQLQALLDDAFRSVPPPGHPLDVNPPQVGPIHRTMTLAEAEESIRREAREHVVIVDASSGLQVARFGPEATEAAGYDPHGLTLIDPRFHPEARASGQWVLSHNHPRCGSLSAPDIVMACALNLHSIRAVCADGWTWWMSRPHTGWPDPFTAQALAEDAAAVASEAAQALCITPEDIDVWTRHFNAHFVRIFNQLGTHFGLQVQGASGEAVLRPAHRRSGLATEAAGVLS